MKMSGVERVRLSENEENERRRNFVSPINSDTLSPAQVSSDYGTQM